MRDDGRRLPPDALSEGTQDQLFLALRLATLEDHATRAEPLPFVGDDLFVTFDEARTAAALRALAEFGARTGQGRHVFGREGRQGKRETGHQHGRRNATKQLQVCNPPPPRRCTV